MPATSNGERVAQHKPPEIILASYAREILATLGIRALLARA